DDHRGVARGPADVLHGEADRAGDHELLVAGDRRGAADLAGGVPRGTGLGVGGVDVGGHLRGTAVAADRHVLGRGAPRRTARQGQQYQQGEQTQETTHGPKVRGPDVVPATVAPIVVISSWV